MVNTLTYKMVFRIFEDCIISSIHMKRKYFLLGFISGIAFVIAVLVISFFLIKHQSEKSVTEFAAQTNIANAEIEVFAISQKSLDSLYFYDMVKGEILYLSADTANFIFINYWATWCAPCVGEMPEFVKLINRDEIKNAYLKFIFASRESEEKILKFEKSKNFGLPYYLFEDKSQPTFINHNTIPTSYLIDKNKLLVYKFSGVRQWDSELYRNLLTGM